MVGADGCGKSATFDAAQAALARQVRVFGISEQVTCGGPTEPIRERHDIPLGRSARLVGRLAKRLGQPRLYRNLKTLELVERSRMLDFVCCHERPEVVLCDGAPLVNSAAWSAARFYSDYLRTDDELATLIEYLSGRRAIAVRDLLPVARRSWELVLINRLRIVRMQVPHRIFLLQIDPAVAMARIRARGKPLQAHETEGFLGVLAGGYERACDLLERGWGVTVTRLRTDRLSIEDVAARVADECLGAVPTWPRGAG